MSRFAFVIAWLVIFSSLVIRYSSFAANGDVSFFEQKIRPVLIDQCYECHSAQAKKVRGSLLLDSKAGWQKGGDSGQPAIVPGQPDASPLIRAMRHDSDDLAMPPKKPKLPAAVLADFVTWVKSGATDPRDGVKLEATRADKSWWSLQPLSNPEPPAPTNLSAAWSENPIDRFVFAKLAEKNLQPNPPADARALIRRVTYDLTGLPPTMNEVESFARAYGTNSSSAIRHSSFAQLVDRLLASPRYGERWGRHWLDVVRFGESIGFERNPLTPDLWPFRDYVIRSFNDDKPFDRFITEHLAGDVIGKDQPDVEVGSAFLVAGPYDDVGNQDVVAQKNIRAATLDEIITTAGGAFLGLTINCARCHHHKFDPIPTEDYYRLRAAFEGVTHGRRVVATAAERKAYEQKTRPLKDQKAKLTKESDALKKSIEQRAKAAAEKKAVATPEEQKQQVDLKSELARVQRELDAVPPLRQMWVGNYAQPKTATFVQKGGDPMKPGEIVAPASLAVLDGVGKPYALATNAPEGERRLALARWIVGDENPLTPRVLANRVWHYHFGVGLVDTPGDFGFLGSRPTHPELLDFLAQRLRAHGWKLKALHREILLSQTYQQSSAFRANAAGVDRDARLLWRFPPRRLGAEEVRDTLLTVAGKMKLEPMGGPGFRLYRHFENNVSTYFPLDQHGPETYRRAVYHQNARASVVDVLSDFDLPDIAFAAPRRANTTTPLQTLTLFNHSFTLDMAGALATRLGEKDEVETAFALAFQRTPTSAERAAAEKLIAAHGRAAFCRALLNANELIHLE